jgi:hypothetical protein
MSVLGIVLTILVIVLIVMFFIYYFQDPYTLQNLQNGQNSSTINATSLATNGSNIPSSNFAYSIWFFVNDFNYRYGEPKVIFGRMGSPSKSKSGSVPGISGVDPCPAVVLGAVSNDLEISLGCFPGVDQIPSTPNGNSVVTTCTLANVPIQKWVNLTISVYGRSLDVYIDGKLAKTCLLPGVANINTNSDVYITPLGGFSGWTSRFQYFPNPLNPQEAYNIYTKGYGGNLFNNFLQGYQVTISLLQNGTPQSSVTI